MNFTSWWVCKSHAKLSRTVWYTRGSAEISTRSCRRFSVTENSFIKASSACIYVWEPSRQSGLSDIEPHGIGLEPPGSPLGCTRYGTKRLDRSQVEGTCCTIAAHRLETRDGCRGWGSYRPCRPVLAPRRSGSHRWCGDSRERGDRRE